MDDETDHNPPDEDWADDLPTFAWRQEPAEVDTEHSSFAMDPPQVPFTLTIPTLEADRFHNLDDVMLHAAFAVLRQFLETEYPGRVMWRKSDLTELEELYRWWERTWMIMRPHTDEQDREDNEMLIRLVRIRHVLWT